MEPGAHKLVHADGISSTDATACLVPLEWRWWQNCS